MKFLLVALAALALTGCKVAEEAQAQAQLVAAPLPMATSGWVELTPGPVEIDGEVITPTCSNAPGADPTFRFWARRGTTNNLIVYFDGGGACWDDTTCSLPRLAADVRESDGFYKGELIPSDNPNELGGIFALGDERNPVSDWSMVFVPYCTGDVHSGSNTAHYTNPDTGEPYTIEHRGADNFRVVLEWMRANFDAPDALLVTGSSAGAYGAATHYGRIREAFPEGSGMMLGDAGQGVTTPEFLGQRNNNWRYDLPANVFGENPQLTADDDVVGRLAAYYPADRFAQYTTAHDITQSAFYALMGAPNACQAWTQKMVRDLNTRQGVGNFRAYLASGQSHTILRTPLFFTERSGGVPFSEWVGAMVGDGAGWHNRQCANCLTERVRCPF